MVYLGIYMAGCTVEEIIQTLCATSGETEVAVFNTARAW